MKLLKIKQIEPNIHEENLNNLDVQSYKKLSRKEINDYYDDIKYKIQNYVSSLSDKLLLEFPDLCEYTKFTLILAQFRHLHTNMWIIMGLSLMILIYGLMYLV